MENLCRFCGYKGYDLNPIAGNKILAKFLEYLPSEITQYDDTQLPQKFCYLCNLKIVETIEFFDRIAELYRNFIENVHPPEKYSVEILPIDYSDSDSKDDCNNSTFEHRIGSPTSDSTPFCVDPLDILKYELEESNEQDEIDVGGSADRDENNIKVEDDELYKPILKSTQNKTKRTRVQDQEEKDLNVSISKYVCSRCQEEFDSPTLLKNHMSEFHKFNYTCKYCEKKFYTRANRTAHEKRHEKENPPVHHECTNCKRKFGSVALLVIHRQKCTGETIGAHLVGNFTCTECGEILNSSAQLLKHTDNHAITISRKHLTCEICGQIFNRKPLYHDHIRSHPELATFECDLCDRKFHIARLLHAHRYEHSGVKSNICPDCGKGFVKKSSMHNHRRREHTGETPFQCQICNMRFYTNDRLRIHQYRHIFKD